MCDVCKIKNLNPYILNGNKPTRLQQKLYRFFKDNVANLSLCYVHSIELFGLGERRFITKYPYLVREVTSKTYTRNNKDSMLTLQAA